MREEKNKKNTNYLLDGLPLVQQKVILAQCETIHLVTGETLFEQDQLIGYVLFPLTAFIALVKSCQDHPPLETGLIGHEGMLGVTRILGVNTAPERAVVQGAGTALRLTADQFQDQLQRHPLLLKRLKFYLYIVLAQQAQSLACVRFHHIEPRLARWLLMAHDRAQANVLHLTHKFLADMLGVRRSGITIAAGLMQQNNLIAYSRGDIRVLDRKGLELIACECYAHSKTDYSRLLN